jgi:cytidylate kinase
MVTLPNVEAILERQAKLWDMQRCMNREARAGATGKQEDFGGPWICVSRQLGSGGTELARRLGVELGWEVYDRQILETIAGHTHTRSAVLSRLDERTVGPMIEYIRRLLDPEIPGQTDFLQQMLRVIWGLARQGNTIIVGRGANWFLDPRSGLRVRVVAPFDVRVARLARGEKPVRQNDERQSNFVRKVFGQAIDDPLGYDLVLNTGSVDLSSAVRASVAALQPRITIAARACD